MCRHALLPLTFPSLVAACVQESQLDLTDLECHSSAYDASTCTFRGTDCYDSEAYGVMNNNATVDLTACPMPSGTNRLVLKTKMVDGAVSITCVHGDFVVVVKGTENGELVFPDGYVLPSADQAGVMSMRSMSCHVDAQHDSDILTVHFRAWLSMCIEGAHPPWPRPSKGFDAWLPA